MRHIHWTGTLTQEAYIQRVLRTFNMESEHVKPVDTPCKSGPPLSKKDAVKYERGEDHPWPFRSLLGSIIYACITRCDIQYAVSVLAKFCSCPDVKAWNAARRVLRFVRRSQGRIARHPNSHSIG